MLTTAWMCRFSQNQRDLTADAKHVFKASNSFTQKSFVSSCLPTVVAVTHLPYAVACVVVINMSHKMYVEDNECIFHVKTLRVFKQYYLRCTLGQQFWEKLHSVSAALPCIRPWHLETCLPNIQQFNTGLSSVPGTTKTCPRRTKYSCNECLKVRPAKPTFR